MPGRRYDLDAVLVGDVWEGREPAEALLAVLRALRPRGLAVGIAPLVPPTDHADAVHPDLAEAVRTGDAVLVEPSSDGPLWCRLAVVAWPFAPERPSAARPSLPDLRAERALVLATEGVLDRKGRPRPELRTAAALVAGLAPEQRWCPADDGVREQLRQAGMGGLLHPEDWPPAVDTARPRTARPPVEGRRIVIGHATGLGVEPPAADRAGLLERYPLLDEGAATFRLWGDDEAGLRALCEPLPPGWQVVPREAAGRRRFVSRLDFLALQPERPPRHAPPRGLLEAMAAGRVALLAPGFRPLLGDGLAYRTPEQVTETARYLQAEPAFYARYLAAQDRALERFSTEALWRRLEPFLGSTPRRPPRPRRGRREAAAPARPPGRRRVAFYPTNGVGLGHVARLLAIARRLGAAYEPVFFTPCHALAVIENAGYRAEYVSEPGYDATAPADNARAWAPSLARAFRHHDVAGVVFDGNVPREALVLAAAERDLPFVWVRRGMWRADPGLARFVELSRHADVVIEPGEAAAAADGGATAAAGDGAVRVPPVTLLGAEDLPGRAEARRALGLPADRPCALVQLGSGNNRDTEGLLDPVLAAAARLGVEVMVAEWLISEAPVRRPGVRYLSAFPNARHLNAFDFAISAAGYNSFHELLHHGVPAIFLPNDDQRVDDQRARAAFADAQGAGVCVPRGAEAQVGRYVEIVLDRGHRRLMARKARALCPENGALAAAAAVEAAVGRG